MDGLRIGALNSEFERLHMVDRLSILDFIRLVQWIYRGFAYHRVISTSSFIKGDFSDPNNFSPSNEHAILSPLDKHAVEILIEE